VCHIFGVLAPDGILLRSLKKRYSRNGGVKMENESPPPPSHTQPPHRRLRQAPCKLLDENHALSVFYRSWGRREARWCHVHKLQESSGRAASVRRFPLCNLYLTDRETRVGSPPAIEACSLHKLKPGWDRHPPSRHARSTNSHAAHIGCLQRAPLNSTTPMTQTGPITVCTIRNRIL
jgi:hypothetical protein